MPIFPFAQFDVPGRLGLDDGRYLIRDEAGEADDVFVVSTLGAPRRGRRRRGRHARLTDDAGNTETLPLTRATVVRATPFDGVDDAKRWLAEITREPEVRDAFAAEALALVNHAIHVHRAATLDPYLAELGQHTPVATRVGFGAGDELAAGRWTKAVDAPPDPGRRERRAEALRPSERVGAVLGRRDRVLACETLVLRARLDFDAGRPREAALQLEPALRAVVAELAADATGDQRDDVASAASRLGDAARIREEALGGELGDGSLAWVGESVDLCERILRRRRVVDPGA